MFFGNHSCLYTTSMIEANTCQLRSIFLTLTLLACSGASSLLAKMSQVLWWSVHPGLLCQFSWKKHEYDICCRFCRTVLHVWDSWLHTSSCFTVCWVCFLFSTSSLIQCWNVLLSDVIILFRSQAITSYSDFRGLILSFPALLDISLNEYALQDTLPFFLNKRHGIS